MIKPINITPLNTTNKLEYKCKSCGDFGVITLENGIINTDNDGNSREPLDDYKCPKCGKIL